MQVELTNKFKKQVENCRDPRIKLKISEIIHTVIATDSMQGISNLKKLSGYKNCFRIRLGNYRLGIFVDDKTVIFSAFDHRSEIYKYFP